MEEQNNFNQEQPKEETLAAIEETSVDSTEEQAFSAPENASENQTVPAPEAPNDAQPAENANRMPQWYGVTYQGSTPEPQPLNEEKPQKKKSKFGKVMLIAVLVLACLITSALAGIGAYMFFGERSDSSQGNSPDSPSNSAPGSENINGLGNVGLNNPTYEYTDTTYDYATAFSQIEKNDGSALEGSSNGSAGSSPKSLIEATAAVKDSVVEITTTVVSNRGQITAGAGSGVIIHKDGIVVTNNHVIADCDKIYVRLTNGDTYEAALRGTDEEGDIAILKITPQEGKPLTVAKLGNSKALALGEEVIAIGNPLGELGGTVTNGIISATEREINVDGVKMKLLQTNAAINSGNSGGGLFNLAGELIGVVNAKYSASGVEGLGFAIPIDSAYEKSIKDLMEVGYIRGVPMLGVTLVEKTGGSIFNMVYGAYVYDTGDVEGFEVGDYIYSIDGKIVYSISTSALVEIKSIVRSHKVGDTLSVVVLRNNEQVTISVTLQEYVPQS